MSRQIMLINTKSTAKRNICSTQCVDKQSTHWQSSKKEVIFCQIEFVGVRGYGRVQFGRKQATARETRCFPCGFYVVC